MTFSIYLKEEYEDSNWSVSPIHTFEDAQKHSHGTMWDTGKEKRWFDMYTQSGPLYVVKNKHNPSEKYQFHVHHGVAADAHDKVFHDKDAFLKHFEQHSELHKHLSNLTQDWGK